MICMQKSSIAVLDWNVVVNTALRRKFSRQFIWKHITIPLRNHLHLVIVIGLIVLCCNMTSVHCIVRFNMLVQIHITDDWTYSTMTDRL